MRTLLKWLLCAAAAGCILATQPGCGGRESGREPPSGLAKPGPR